MGSDFETIETLKSEQRRSASPQNNELDSGSNSKKDHMTTVVRFGYHEEPKVIFDVRQFYHA